ncbi:MAG TPA: quinol:cytochrome C oxidoreductase [Niabella sp.]|nr:quinol:cytochrome C oxidoreductase [Niabella sp.]HOZ95915.1 quinol:cytochrome C oxidoreductase [Niabella sp.]HQW15827.1 quinol:cytochrome C oxidoreductase [Niabella sp.]HQX20967.1 quinol:cytochrome C oxidoreductase [Niabella sp.]HQX41243.1 quinol:cytochrome C oxidoreductase [Niabella sp.]
MSTVEKFIPSKRYNTIAFALMAIGLVAVIALYISTHGAAASEEAAHRNHARFWASLLQNSVYFLLTVNAAMFFMCATTLAWGGWQIGFTRVTEAVAAAVPVIGVIAAVILLAIVFGDNHVIYHWTDTEHVKHDFILNHKKGFLSKGFFTTVTILTVVLWSFLGWKMRQRSLNTDTNSPDSVEDRKKFIWNNTVMAALYIVVFALTIMSTLPWLWLMSINAHWYSTMYSWYTFASTFVAGLAFISLFVVYLKNKGHLASVSKEHLHDLGKFMFAFSIFWTYLWFSQFMLIWYSNQPEETIYFIERIGNSAVKSPYATMFWMMLVINFVGPILILMSRDSKRNYTIMTLVSVLIIFGHWLNFYQMVFPAISPDKVPVMFYDFGVALFFIGLIIFMVGRTLSKHPLVAKNHPFSKESVIHFT